MTWLLGTRLGRWLSIAGAVVMAVLAAWFAGKRDGRRDAEAQAADDYINTRKRADDADLSSGDADADYEWVRDWSERQRRK